MRGRIDGVHEGVLRGWAWDPARPGHRLQLRLVIDGELVTPLTAALPRADLEQAGMGDGRHGLEFPLPLRFQDGAPHEIALETWSYDNVVRLDVATPRIPRRLHMLRGRLESAAGGRLRGWAWDQSRPDTPVALELWQEGRAITRLLADRYRADLAHGGIGGGAHGFDLDLAGLVPEGAELELRCAPEFGEWSLGRLVFQPHAPSGPPPARHFLTEARQAEARQDPAGAARVLEHGLRLHPADFDLLVMRARVHLGLQQWETAEAAARQALALRSDHPGPIALLARLTGLLDRHAEAAALWARIGPEDRAWRERLTRRPHHLAALGRAAEAMAELALAARHGPQDPAPARALADSAEALRAEGAARAHLRRLVAVAPGDAAAARRLGQLDRRLAGGAGVLASPLVNPVLRDWPGPVAGVVSGPAEVAPGVVLRGAALRFALAARRPPRPGELPAYGLRLETGADGGEVEFALAAAPRPVLRMGLELEGEAGLAVTLLLRRSGETDQLLLETRADGRPRLLRFDLSAGEGGALRLRMGEGVLTLHPPHPLSRLVSPPAEAPAGFESPVLARHLGVPARAPRRAARLAEIGLPFTTIELAAPPEAMAETLRAVLDATAPFECLVAEVPPGLADPRLRVLPPGAASAEGWVARVEAPPQGGPGWLAALHRAAAEAGEASAAGVRLSWRAPRLPTPAPARSSLP